MDKGSGAGFFRDMTGHLLAGLDHLQMAIWTRKLICISWAGSSSKGRYGQGSSSGALAGAGSSSNGRYGQGVILVLWLVLDPLRMADMDKEAHLVLWLVLDPLQMADMDKEAHLH
ncbi:hypothetical protein SSS_09621 [Sarcoptes scabiei]|nr:hypothetical protein SSS_09621 [Sarcoptes scabiei]